MDDKLITDAKLKAKKRLAEIISTLEIPAGNNILRTSNTLNEIDSLLNALAPEPKNG